MCNGANIAEEATSLFQNALIVGNHDSITLYGIHSQNSLKDYARRIASILLKEAEHSDLVVPELLCKMERFEGVVNRPKTTFLTNRKRQKEVHKEYQSMLSYIEHVSLYFKLQQAQLIKEIKLLEHFSDAITSATQELESCIEQGKAILSNGSRYSVTDTTLEDRLWYDRLSQRIENLAVSRIISLQSLAQAKVLRENNIRHLDQIANILSNTLPIWQNQMALALGMDLLKARQDMHGSFLSAGKKHMTSFLSQRQHKGEISQMLEADYIFQINLSLRKVLDELVQTETTDNSCRKIFLMELYQPEERENHAK